MAQVEQQVVVITGFGAGLGEELAREAIQRGSRVVGLSRSGYAPGDLKSDCYGISCDVTDEESVVEAFASIRNDCGPITTLINNASFFVLNDFAELRRTDFESVMEVSLYGALACTQQVLPDMLAAGQGTVIFSGATASVKAGPKSAAFAAGKFAVRGLAQSLARAYGPQGIHIAHTILDGVIWGDRAQNRFGMSVEQCMVPADIAKAYFHLIDQRPSSWTQEMDLRPSCEQF